MNNFNLFTPTKVVFGKDTESQTGALVNAFGGQKVLLHYGSGSVVRSGLLDKIKASLQAEGIAFTELGGAVPNPRLSLVYEGIALGNKEGVDFVLAVGGGSAIDSAKAIAYGLAEPEQDVWDLYEHTRTAKACLPIGVVLTLSATGSEMSDSSVITKEEENKKRGYNSDLCRPRFAVMNPALTMTLPDYQTACGCTDIMMHTLERYFTNDGHMEITDGIAEAVLRTVMKNAVILRDDPQNYDARAEVMWAGSLSHNGLTGCGIHASDFASHALEHEIGGVYDVAHGAGLAAIWGSWARYVCDSCKDRFYQFAVNVMEATPSDDIDTVIHTGIEKLEAFFRSIHMPTSLKELASRRPMRSCAKWHTIVPSPAAAQKAVPSCSTKRTCIRSTRLQTSNKHVRSYRIREKTAERSGISSRITPQFRVSCIFEAARLTSSHSAFMLPSVSPVLSRFIGFSLRCRQQQTKRPRHHLEFDAAGIDNLAVRTQAHRALPRCDDRAPALLCKNNLFNARKLHMGPLGIGRELRQKLHTANIVNDIYVHQAVIQPRDRRALNPAAAKRTVRERCQQDRPVLTNFAVQFHAKIRALFFD